MYTVTQRVKLRTIEYFSTFGRDTSPKKGKRILRTLEEEKVCMQYRANYTYNFLCVCRSRKKFGKFPSSLDEFLKAMHR